MDNKPEIKCDYDISDREFEAVLKSTSLASMMEKFYKVGGVSMGIRNNAGEVLITVGWQDICAKFHNTHPKARKCCMESAVHLTKNVKPGEFLAYKCKNNLWDIATPIMLGEKRVGTIFLGQFFYKDEKIDYELFEKQAKKYGFDTREYLAALDRAPRKSRQEIDTIMDFFTDFASVVSQLTYNNTALKKMSEEKELLLKEIHHRVKNHMGTVKSMLSLQMSGLNNKEASDALQEAQIRISLMGSIYEKLYTQEDFRNITIASFLTGLIEEIKQTYALCTNVIVTTDIEDFTISARKSFPIGIIVNELLSNCYKYAFQGEPKGVIDVSIKKTDKDQVAITVSDDGIGIPKEVMSEKSYGFGLTLTQALVDQYEGSFDLHKNGGTTAQIVLNL